MLNLSNGDLFTNSSEAEKELLVLYIEITEGNTQVLTVHHHDNVQELVDKFCSEKELTVHAKSYIVEEIEKNLQYFYPSPPLPESIDQDSADLKFGITNKGVELYLRGQKMKEKIEQKREKIRKERKSLEDQMITLKPTINKSPKRSQKTEQLLLEKGRKTAESLKKKRTVIEEKSRNECTFSPEINKAKEGRSPERYKRLYENARDIHAKILKKSEQL
jgi:hypothetical protein